MKKKPITNNPRRAIKLTLQFATESKRLKIRNLLEAYRGAVNFFIQTIWKDGGGLDGETEKRLSMDHTRLTARYRSKALYQAMDIVTNTRKSAKELGVEVKNIPHFTEGSVALFDSKFIDLEVGRGSFDVVMRLSTLNSGQRIDIPTKKTKILKKWLKKDGARLVQGCGLTENEIIVWVELPEVVYKTEGKSVGLDMGVNKLMAMSEGKNSTPVFFGLDFNRLSKKIRRKKRGSKGMFRALQERDNYIHREINKLPWDELKMVVVEDLRGIKKGKRPNRGKSFRKAMVPWVVRRALTWIGCKAEENRVFNPSVTARYSSRTCLECDKESEKNRVGERFCCVACGYQADADFVGATNTLVRGLKLQGPPLPVITTRSTVESVGLSIGQPIQSRKR